VLVIYDEVQSGFFRTGKFWDFQHFNVMPDIITMSKGLGGIGFPISAIIYNKNIEAWSTADHIGTFRGNQVSISAGNAAFGFIEENGVAGHVTEMGHYLMEKLRDMMPGNPFMGDVRGRGLFVGIEYVKTKEGKEPFPAFVAALAKNCFERGLLFEVGGHFSNVVRFVPPLIINKEIIDNALSIFEAANACMVNEFSAQLSVV